MTKSESGYPLTGGCDCREVRYQMETSPLFVHCCHCRWCQRETGASFALNAMIEADRLLARPSIEHQIETENPVLEREADDGE